MAWTTPANWTTNQLVTANDLNIQLRDNLSYLFARPRGSIFRDNAGNYTVGNNTFVDMDATNLKITLTPSGTSVLLGFSGVLLGNNLRAAFDINVRNNSLATNVRLGAAGTDGLMAAGGPNTMLYYPISFTAVATGLTAGTSYSFTVQWKTLDTNSFPVLYAGNGTAGQDFIPNFWALEIA